MRLKRRKPDPDGLADQGRLRITYIHQHFKRPDEAGGSRPWEFARRLAADGHHVTMITGGRDSRRYREAGFDVWQIRAPYTNSLGTLGRLASFMRFCVGATAVALSTPSDILLASSTPLTVAVPALVTKMLRKVPFVFEVRDLWPSVPIDLGHLSNPVLIAAARFLERMAYTHAESVIALSPGMAAGVRSIQSDTEVVVIPNAADIERFQADPAARRQARQDLGWTDELIVVYAGSFGATYELGHLVSVANALSSSVRLVLLGEGASTPALRLQAQEFGLDADRLMPGKLPRTEVTRHLVAADAVISSLRDLPALHVNSLNKVFDGLAAGRPIIFTHDGWLSSLVCAKGAGTKVSGTHAAAAAAEILAALSDPGHRRSMGASAIALARSEFDRTILYARFKEVIEKSGLAQATL